MTPGTILHFPPTCRWARLMPDFVAGRLGRPQANHLRSHLGDECRVCAMALDRAMLAALEAASGAVSVVPLPTGVRLLPFMLLLAGLALAWVLFS